jgi:hypothetical protein
MDDAFDSLCRGSQKEDFFYFRIIGHGGRNYQRVMQQFVQYQAPHGTFFAKFVDFMAQQKQIDEIVIGIMGFGISGNTRMTAQDVGKQRRTTSHVAQDEDIAFVSEQYPWPAQGFAQDPSQFFLEFQLFTSGGFLAMQAGLHLPLPRP